MKMLGALVLVSFLAALSGEAQTTQTNRTQQPQITESRERTVRPGGTAAQVTAPPKATYPAVRRKVVYRGALVRLSRTDKPLQLINPFAPAEYGNGYANVSRDLATGKAQGISLFSVEF